MTLFQKDGYKAKEFFDIVIENSILKDVPKDEVIDYMSDINEDNFEEIYDEAFLEEDTLDAALERVAKVTDKKKCAMQLVTVLLMEIMNDNPILYYIFMSASKKDITYIINNSFY